MGELNEYHELWLRILARREQAKANGEPDMLDFIGAELDTILSSLDWAYSGTC